MSDVQTYCAHFPIFMRVMHCGYSFLRRSNFPRTDLFHHLEKLTKTQFSFISQSCHSSFIWSFKSPFFIKMKIFLQFLFLAMIRFVFRFCGNLKFQLLQNGQFFHFLKCFHFVENPHAIIAVFNPSPDKFRNEFFSATLMYMT